MQTFSKAFEKDGPTENDVNRFQVLDTEITECILSASKMVAKNKFGYQRLPTPTQAGTGLYFWKAALSAMSRRVHLGKLQLRQAEKCHIDLSKVHNMTVRKIQTQIREARKELWDTQKNAHRKRGEWLETNSQDIARAAGEIDWEKR